MPGMKVTVRRADLDAARKEAAKAYKQKITAQESAANEQN